MFVRRFIYLLFAIVLIVIPAIGQSPAAPPQETQTDSQKKDEAQAKLNAQTYDLLDAVVKDIQRLRLPQNRAYLSITVGELLWQHDEVAARALFKDAAADLRGFLADPFEAESPLAMRQKMERAQLREKVLFAIAQHDSRLALELMAETRPVSTAKEDDTASAELDLETRLAAVIAANDPTRALEMAKKSLAKGFSFTLASLLIEIRQKDPDAATGLAGDILSKLKSANLATNDEAALLAVRIFEIATEPSQSKGNSETKAEKPLLSDQYLGELAELIAAAALNSRSENGGHPLNIGSIITQLVKYAPSRAQQLERLKAQPSVEVSSEQQAYQTYQKLLESGSAAELLAAAEKAEPEMREAYYRQAAFLLANDDKMDQARQVITEHITEPDQRQQILAQLDKQVLSVAASKGKMEETRKLLSSASTNEERISILTQLALAVAEKGDKKVALQLLEEARNLSAGRTRYSRQLLARLQIAHAYAGIDPAQSLAILEPTIDQLNELIGAAIILGEFFGEEEIVRDDELLVLYVGQLSDMFRQQFGKALGLLAAADFPRTREAVERFQRFEVRIMARLLVVQSLLSKDQDEPNKSPASTNGTKVETSVPVSTSAPNNP